MIFDNNKIVVREDKEKDRIIIYGNDTLTRELAYTVAMSNYIGRVCPCCKHTFTSIEDLETRHAIYGGAGTIYCEICWKDIV